MQQPITSKLAILTEMMDGYLRAQNQALHWENEELAARVSTQNRLIAQLEQDINHLIDALAESQRENEAFRRATRILYNANGTSALFARNSNGVYVQVEDAQPPLEEPTEEIARRLNFEQTEEDEESDTDFLMRLYGFIE